MIILPRRYLKHSEPPPNQPGMPRRCFIINGTIPSSAAACSEYTAGADLLRQLGLDIAASLLERTAAALATPALIVRPDSDSDTQVCEVPADSETA